MRVAYRAVDVGRRRLGDERPGTAMGRVDALEPRTALRLDGPPADEEVEGLDRRGH